MVNTLAQDQSKCENLTGKTETLKSLNKNKKLSNKWDISGSAYNNIGITITSAIS